ncbi:uncharacterized protein LOC8274257 isoform X1 [Ricinus communis]|nr:uncharacterized protein LOC8274257 isoform X1 [Ricinus communis]
MSTALATMRLLLTTTSTASFLSSSSSSSSLDFPSKSLKTGNPIFNHSCPARRKALSLSNLTWLCGYMRRDQDMDSWKAEEENLVSMFGPDEDTGTQIPTQAQSLVEGSSTVVVAEYKPVPDVDYLQELLAIQQQGPRAIGFFGTRNMGFMHQELIEILSYALVITKNHIFTSGASGTNAAVIRGALRAEKPELLTVILPQSLKKQPPESQELLAKVQNVIEKPHNDHLPLIEASRLCNMDIISHVQQVICFAFHDSKLLMETCQEAKNLRKIVTLFYLD